VRDQEEDAVEDREQRARRSIEAFGGPEWEATLRELASPALVHEETGSGRRLDGLDAVLEGLQGWKAAFPDVRGEVVRIVDAGDTTALDVVWTGTHTGPLPTATGVLPPTGAAVSTRATMWLRWEDDRVVHQHHHLDMLAMLGQLGALPTAVDA
jgi:predicted ester cyclase